jgi:hypothetical protein
VLPDITTGTPAGIIMYTASEFMIADVGATQLTTYSLTSTLPSLCTPSIPLNPPSKYPPTHAHTLSLSTPSLSTPNKTQSAGSVGSFGTFGSVQEISIDTYGNVYVVDELCACIKAFNFTTGKL